MTTLAARLGLSSPPAVVCDVVADAAVGATVEQLAHLRQGLALPGAEPLSPSFLKHLDDQTVVALEAVGQALRRAEQTVALSRAWGVIAASAFLGRAACASALHRYTLDGAWGVSPHLIPHRSLHSPAGALSQVLKAHGPNLGVGGGPEAVAEGLLTAAALLDGGAVPGVWLVLSGWRPEPAVDELGQVITAGARCHARALGLVPARPGSGRPTLCLFGDSHDFYYPLIGDADGPALCGGSEARGENEA